MKVSYNLLQKYINLEGRDLHTLAPAIAEHCFEVENIQKIGAAEIAFSGVFAAKVLSVEKHPNADRLQVVSLDLGKQVITPVVCGAHNFKAGDMVCLALPGAHIPQNIHSEQHESFILGSAKIRGIESQGMICSGFELGLRPTPEENPEILVLPESIPIGLDLKEYFEKQAKGIESDFMVDFALPANRPDLHSHIGIARELSGMLDIKATKKLLQANEIMVDTPKLPRHNATDKSLHVDIQTPLCVAYVGVRMAVKISATPKEILSPLKTMGHDGVNNVVDITNYVLSVCGQPLHAFDAAAIEDNQIVVRSSHPGEQLKALDGKNYTLPEDSIVIADRSKALALGGIIGGDQSKILDTTTEIIIEAALFEPAAIRKTSKKIGLRTEASGLFEKGSSPEQLAYALHLAIQLLEEYAGGRVLEVFATPLPKTEKMPAIRFTSEGLNSLIGSDFSEAQVKKTLDKLNVPVSGSKTLSAIAPWYRKDIEDLAGLADEVLRFSGMNLISKQPLALRRNSLQYNREAEIWNAKQSSALLGYSEVQGYSFISVAEIQAAKRNPAEYIKISNPLSSETEYLRQNLAEGLLKIVGLNAKHSDSFKLFEVGYAYFGYMQEQLLLALAIYKKQFTSERNLAELKGDVQALLKSLGLHGQVSWQPGEGNTATIFYEKQPIGAVNILSTDHPLARRNDIDSEVLLCQLALDILFPLSKNEVFKQFGRFPISSLDLSIVVSENVSWSQIEEIARKNGGEFLRDIQVIDAPYFYTKNTMRQFHKNLLKEGRKNLVFRLVFAAADHTLKDSEFSGNYAKIIERLSTDLKAEIR
jgi:phenylalanyl-tRNA synthetase beta chain